MKGFLLPTVNDLFTYKMTEGSCNFKIIYLKTEFKREKKKYSNEKIKKSFGMSCFPVVMYCRGSQPWPGAGSRPTAARACRSTHLYGSELWQSRHAVFRGLSCLEQSSHSMLVK
jgi:hypothetical protein